MVYFTSVVSSSYFVLIGSFILKTCDLLKKRLHTETILKVWVKQSLPTSVPVTERTFHGHMQGLALVLKCRKDDWTKFEILKEHYVNWFLSMDMTPSSPFHSVRDAAGKVFPRLKVFHLVWVEEYVGGWIDGQEEVVHFDQHHHPGGVDPLAVPDHLKHNATIQNQENRFCGGGV